MHQAFVQLTRNGMDYLKNVREERGLAQSEIKVFDQSSISDWEVGRYAPNLQNLRLYLSILNIKESFLQDLDYVSAIDYKFKIPNIPKQKKINIHFSKDLHIILTKKGRKKIVEARKNIGSQNALSFLSRVDQSTISDWERNISNPTLKRFRNYLTTLSIEANEFLHNKILVKEIKRPIIKRMIDKSADSRRKPILAKYKLTKEKAYVLGVIGPGDGWLGRDRIELMVTDKDFAISFQKNAEKSYGLKSKIKLQIPKNPKHKLKFRVRVYSKNLCDDIRKYKGPFREKIWRVPKKIKESSKACKAEYIKGVFDSQGHVSVLKYELRAGILNIPGLYELQSILHDLNITSRVSKRASRLNITSKENLQRYYDIVGFDIERKQKALGKLLSSYVYK